MKVHEIKIIEKYADRVFDGSKILELRKKDRDYQTGDVLKFDVVGEDFMSQFKTDKTDRHPLQDKPYLITYMLDVADFLKTKTGGDIDEDWVILAIAPCDCAHLGNGWYAVPNGGNVYMGEPNGNTEG